MSLNTGDRYCHLICSGQGQVFHREIGLNPREAKYLLCGVLEFSPDWIKLFAFCQGGGPTAGEDGTESRGENRGGHLQEPPADEGRHHAGVQGGGVQGVPAHDQQHGQGQSQQVEGRSRPWSRSQVDGSQDPGLRTEKTQTEEPLIELCLVTSQRVLYFLLLSLVYVMYYVI